MSETTYEFPIFAAATRANPQAVYEQMRQHDPIHRAVGPISGNTFWFFTRYEDVVAVLKDPRFGKNIRKNLPELLYRRYVPQDPHPIFAAINNHLLEMDPPDHTRLRALVHKGFTPRMIQALEPRIREIAEELLSAMVGKDRVDLLESFAFPLPITVISEMLGVHSTMRDKFREWTRTLLFGMNEEAQRVATLEFILYMNELIEERRKDYKADVLGELVRAEEAGDSLNQEELLSMIFLLLVAGHETTVNLIGNGTLLLMQHPEQMQKLIENPLLIRTAVEEMLRYNGPVETPTWRWAFEDVMMGDKVIRQGDVILPSLLAANRDPNVFENANEFDIMRDPNRHVAFGVGIHYCIGAPLARLEGTIALQALVKRHPQIRLAVDERQLQWNQSLLLHGMQALPVYLS